MGNNGDNGFIRAESLVKTYLVGASRVDVLTGLDLEVSRGESVGVVGASGVGKSTLLHLLGGLDRPTAGRVLLDDQDLGRLDDRSLARVRNRKIGFVFQFHHLLPEFNALENVAMPALIARRPREEALDKASTILERVGLAARLKHRVGELSGGEQQRVAVARALVMAPEVLLADEPTGNLDSQTGRRINELLLSLNEERGLTSIVVTHNLELAAMLSRRITLVDGLAVEEE